MLRELRSSIVASCLILAVLTGAGMPPAAAQSRQSETIKDKPSMDGGRYSKKEQGWFWYVEEPEPVPVEIPPPPPPAQTSASPVEKKLKPFSAEWIAKKLDETRLVAIDNPTKDNMERYLLLQKLAMDKSEQFALAHRQYASLNPGIDETIQNPVGGTSRSTMNRARTQAMDDVLHKIGDVAGIWYFFSSECPFCHKQNPVINMLSGVHNLSVLPISLDARSSTDGLLPHWRPDRGQAAMLGVQGTPTMYIVNPSTNRIVLLASGVRTLPDLQRRIVEIAKAENWISEEDYDSAMRGLPRRFLTEGLDLDDDVEDDPDVILALLRQAAVHGQVQETSLDAVDQTTMTPWAPQQSKQ